MPLHEYGHFTPRSDALGPCITKTSGVQQSHNKVYNYSIIKSPHLWTSASICLGNYHMASLRAFPYAIADDEMAVRTKTPQPAHGTPFLTLVRCVAKC